jgi:hypothetical protein
MIIHELRLMGMERGNVKKSLASLRQMLKMIRSEAKSSAKASSPATSDVKGSDEEQNANMLDLPEEGKDRDAYDSDATDCSEIGGFQVFSRRKARV